MNVKFNFKIAENSLFAILLRSRWWVSFLVVALVLLIAGFLVPETYFVPTAACALPFLAIGVHTAWHQLRLPGASRVAATIEAVRAMSWREFSARMEQAFLREGYTVTRLAGPADFKLARMGRTTLVCCKRWKAARHGVEMLRELDERREGENAQDALYVALDGVTDKAREFAGKHRIRLMDRRELTGLLRLSRKDGNGARG
jgi:restriction system protein